MHSHNQHNNQRNKEKRGKNRGEKGEKNRKKRAVEKTTTVPIIPYDRIELGTLVLKLSHQNELLAGGQEYYYAKNNMLNLLKADYTNLL